MVLGVVRPAHPCERGDDAPRSKPHDVGRGSSPRAGRRRDRGREADLLPGLIPASGETTSPPRTPCAVGSAHPRERGDDPTNASWTPFAHGSSPRAGRRRRGCDRRCVSAGLIPASGETTGTDESTRTRGQAHPRERGDDSRTRASRSVGAGSSPRAGRRRHHGDREAFAGGLIPASGETTTTPPARTAARRAHPRERGDDHRFAGRTRPVAGSSPRAGRRPAAVRACPGVGRLIPASGETTTPRTRAPPSRPAHPRERGDDTG